MDSQLAQDLKAQNFNLIYYNNTDEAEAFRVRISGSSEYFF